MSEKNRQGFPVFPPFGWEEHWDPEILSWTPRGETIPSLTYAFASSTVEICIADWRVPKCLAAFRKRVASAVQWRKERDELEAEYR